MIKVYGDIEEIERVYNKIFSELALYIDEDKGIKYYILNKRILFVYKASILPPNILMYDYSFFDLSKYYLDFIRLKIDFNEYLRKYIKEYLGINYLFLIKFEDGIKIKRRDRKKLKRQYTRKDKLENIFGKYGLMYG